MMETTQHLSSNNDHVLSDYQYSGRNKLTIVVFASLVPFFAGYYAANRFLPLRRPNEHTKIRGDSCHVSTATSKAANDATPSDNKKKEDQSPDLGLNRPPLLAPSGPQVAWLLSFPNSGTSYTVKNIQRLTNRSTATNYAMEMGTGFLSVGPDENGPFVSVDGKRPLPEHYILTKTHCGGRCGTCIPENFVVNTVEEFEKECRRSLVPNGNVLAPCFYPKGTATRAIHLFRHPLNNLVSRMHLEMKKNPAGFPKGFSAQVAQLETERERVLAWCKYTDTLIAPDTAATPLLPNSTKLIIQRQQPLCALELFKYVQWHERAREMTTQLGFPILYTYYEDYMTQYNTTVSRILEFLEATPAAGTAPKLFVPHPPYKVFTKEQEDTMMQYIQQLSSKEGWKLLERYFQ